MNLYGFDSAANVTSGFAATSVAGMPDKMCGSVRYNVKVRSSSTLGLLYATLRWTDRAGNSVVKTSPALALTNAGAEIGNEYEVYAQDNGGLGSVVTLEIQTVGVLGSFSYDYFVQTEGEQGN